MALLAVGAGHAAGAQTAHFSGVQTTLGSGFSNPAATAVDSNGNVFVADFLNNAVKEMLAVGGTIPASPTIQTLGSGFSHPSAVAVDAKGDVFVADEGHGSIKEMLAVSGSIPASPTINTLTTIANPQGVALDAAGDVYVTGGCNGPINGTPCGNLEQLVAVSGVVPSNPTIVVLPLSPSGPGGVALDNSGNVYLVDIGNNRVEEVLAVNGAVSASSSTRIVTTFSGPIGPAGVAVDSRGDVFVSDSGNNLVTEFTAVNGSIPSTIPANLIRTLGTGFSLPGGLAVDGNGNLYVADVSNNRVELISPSDAAFGSVNVRSTGAALPLLFTFDTAGMIGSTAVLTQGAASLDFADAVTGTCTANTAFTAGQTCTFNVTFAPQFSGARYGAAVLKDGSGNVFATGNLYGNGVGPQVNFLPGTQSSLGSGFFQPWGVAVDGSGNVFVADTNNHQVEELVAVNGSIPASPTINVIGISGGNPARVAVDGAGNVYIADSFSNIVYEILKAGGYTTNVTLGGGFSSPSGIAVDARGNVFVADYGNNAVKEIPPGCILASCVSTVGQGFSSPIAVAVDGAENVYVADTNNQAVKQIVAAGGYATINTLLTGISFLGGVAVDAQADVFASDTVNNNVLEILKAGGYTTVNTVPGTFSQPFGLAITGSGNLLVANTGNDSITLMDFADAPSLSFASTTEGSTSSDSPKTLTVENIGNAALSFPIPAIGNDPSITAPFTLNSSGGSACPLVSSGSSTPGSLAPSAFCLLPVSFSPLTVGSLSGSLVLTDNNLNLPAPAYASQTIVLSGTSVAGPHTATITVSAVSIAPGTATASLSALVAYTGGTPPSGALNFQVDSGAVVAATCTGSSSPRTCTYASYATAALAIGTHTITATLVADANYTTAMGTNNLNVLLTSASPAVWLGNTTGSLSAFTLAGAPVTGSSGFTGAGVGTIASGLGIAFDASGDAWIASSNGVSEFSQQGVAITPSAYTIGGIDDPQAIAVDGAGQVWVANANGTISVLNNTGTAISPSTGYASPGSAPAGIAIDISGNVWIPGKTANTVTRILGAAAPVVPLATGAGSGAGVKP